MARASTPGDRAPNATGAAVAIDDPGPAPVRPGKQRSRSRPRHVLWAILTRVQTTADPEDTLAPGTELGRYQIVRLMGRGGMGAVYEATHRDLKKRVAIKTLHPAVAATPGARARFLREGEAASRIRHPNVVDVTDVAAEGSIAYLVMEFLEGEDLSSLLERAGALPFSESVDLLLPVFAAISVAHDEGVIHRDLKPENIFLSQSRHGGAEPKVLDFGISKLSSSGGGNTLALTGTGASMGTPYYVA